MPLVMSDGDIETALQRAERAVSRIEAAIRLDGAARKQNELLRERVRNAIADLDTLIQEAGS